MIAISHIWQTWKTYQVEKFQRQLSSLYQSMQTSAGGMTKAQVVGSPMQMIRHGGFNFLDTSGRFSVLTVLWDVACWTRGIICSVQASHVATWASCQSVVPKGGRVDGDRSDVS